MSISIIDYIIKPPDYRKVLLADWNISDGDQNFTDIVHKVVNRISGSGEIYKKIFRYICEYDFIPQTTILQNANRFPTKPLTACAVPALDLQTDFHTIRQNIDNYHEQGMGTGFNLDNTQKPVEVLQNLDEITIVREKLGKRNRPTGNMAILSIDHPEIMNYINAKVDKNTLNNFNLSVNVTEKFMLAAINKDYYALANGNQIAANDLLDSIAEIAHQTGEPGLIFMDRFHNRNPVPHLGKYHSVAPCSEVAMTSGETCQFGYINIGNFIKEGCVDYSRLQLCITYVVQFLDDALEYSIKRYQNSNTAKIMKAKRKIAIGLCGWQDLLVKLEIPYDSNAARELASDIMSFINFYSKQASMELADIRGSFEAFADKRTGYQNNHLERLFAISTNTIHGNDWLRLQNNIKKYGIRHCSTTALPPTGRSSIIINASPQIEPYFSLYQKHSAISDIMKRKLSLFTKNKGLVQHILKQMNEKGSIQNIPNIPASLYPILKTATELSIEAHIKMVSAFQKYNDESVSKTVNLPAKATVDQVRQVFESTFYRGLLGITVYVDQSRNDQPEKL